MKLRQEILLSVAWPRDKFAFYRRVFPLINFVLINEVKAGVHPQ